MRQSAYLIVLARRRTLSQYSSSKIIILLLESKKTKTVARSRDFRAQDVALGLPKSVCGWGRALDPAGRAYSALQNH